MTKQLLFKLIIIIMFLINANAMEGPLENIDHMKVSLNGVKLIARFEGFRETIYTCPGGMPTIGFGHVVKESEREKFVNGLSRKAAEELLESDLNKVYIPGLKRKVKVPLSQAQFDVLASFIYNLGETNLGISELLKLLNGKNYDKVASQFPRWSFANKKYYPGLFKRRLAEMFIFQGNTTIPDELGAIKLGNTEQTLLMAYQNLNASLKEEAVQIYLAYKGIIPDGL